MTEIKDSYGDGETSVEKPEKMLTVEEIKEAMKNPDIKLTGRISLEVLEAFLCVSGYCAFSEAMAEGTDSWINQARVWLDESFLQLDLSGVTGLEDAREVLRTSLRCYPYGKLTNLVYIAEGSEMHVALDDRYIDIKI